jgi:ribonucleoside-diphosphate reductase beta chain
VPLADDVKDWHRTLSAGEQNLVTQIFRFFTQSDVEVNNCYMKHYSQVFKPTEVLMMLSAFSNIETIHIAAYSHLLDTIGMPEIEYSAFLKYKEMKDKYDYMQAFSVANKREIAKTLAAFGAFTEGLQLFASFAILLNFPRFNKLKGMGQIVSWSVRDETLHCLSIIRLFRVFVQENPEIWTDELRAEITQICATIVEHEDAFIDLAFELGAVEGLNAEQVKTYIRFIADRRLTQLGLDPLYHIESNPLPWVDDMLNAVEHANFFENRATEYSRASTQGTWEEAFEGSVFERA